MGDITGIGWTGRTWNPWQGCDRVSPGCDFCYMFAQKYQYGQDPTKVVRSAPATFFAPLKWQAPSRVFTCSWSDWFHATADPWREEAWSIIQRTPHLTYQILTKRPSRIKNHMPSNWWLNESWQNVWLGVSIESQKYLHRADVLREIPAAKHFLSLEPLLEDLGDLDLTDIDWGIVGAESGADRRPFELSWLRRIVDQFREQGKPIFVKQDGAFRPGQRGRIPDDLWIQEFPK